MLRKKTETLGRDRFKASLLQELRNQRSHLIRAQSELIPKIREAILRFEAERAVERLSHLDFPTLNERLYSFRSIEARRLANLRIRAERETDLHAMLRRSQVPAYKIQRAKLALDPRTPRTRTRRSAGRHEEEGGLEP